MNLHEALQIVLANAKVNAQELQKIYPLEALEAEKAIAKVSLWAVGRENVIAEKLNETEMVFTESKK